LDVVVFFVLCEVLYIELYGPLLPWGVHVQDLMVPPCHGRSLYWTIWSILAKLGRSMCWTLWSLLLWEVCSQWGRTNEIVVWCEDLLCQCHLVSGSFMSMSTDNCIRPGLNQYVLGQEFFRFKLVSVHFHCIPMAWIAQIVSRGRGVGAVGMLEALVEFYLV